MWGIYARPLLTAIPVLLLVEALKSVGVSGQTWPQLILAGALSCTAFYLPACFICVTPEHRKLMLHSLTGLVTRMFPRKIAVA
jgi:hypothetical protein